MTSILLVILVSVVVSTIIGSVWYLPQVFGTLWMNDVHLDPKTIKKESMTAALVTSMICNAVIGVVLWYARNTMFREETLQTFLIGVVIAWFAFIFCVRLMHTLFEGRSLRYVAIVSGHDLVSLLVTGSIVYYI